MKKQLSKRRAGVVMLLALLLMAAITASTIAVSVVINSTTHQSKNLDDFVIASLSADSGIERSLAIVKVGRASANLATTVGAANGYNGTTTSNASSFNVVTAEGSSPLVVPELKTGQSISFDLLKQIPCPGGSPLPACPPADLLITGATTSSANANLDVSWVIIDANGNTNYSGRKFATKAVYDPGTWLIHLNDDIRTDVSNSLLPFSGSGPILGYRITVRAVSNPSNTTGIVKNLTATPYDGLNPAKIPSNISITSTGQAGSTRSIKTASVLWQLPSSKLFNYTLFTEGPIIPCGSIESSGCL